MSGIAAISAGAAVAGAAAAAYGAMKKGEGVAQNNGQKDAITQEQLQRQADKERQANEIATWYNAQNAGLADETDVNSKKTISGADGAAYGTARTGAEASRAATGNALIDAAPNPVNYADNAPDSSGAVKSENANQLVKALNLGHARANAGAKVNSYGDALMSGGINIAKGSQDQAAINRRQGFVDRTAAMRSTLNDNSHQYVLSPQDAYANNNAGMGNINTGSALMAGGNVVSALGSNGTLGKGADYFGTLFQGAVPRQAGVMGPQQPGIFSGLWN